MAVRYEPGDDRPDEYMPDHRIVDENEETNDPLDGDLCTLLSWHNRFGPTDIERRRNDRVFELQENRNPFIDEPGWANMVWGRQASGRVSGHDAGRSRLSVFRHMRTFQK